MAGKYRRFSLSQGATICVIGLALGALAWQLGVLWTRHPLPVRVILFLLAWFSFWFFVHDLTHHAVGKMLGIRFQFYFLGRSAIRKLKLPLVSSLMEKVPILVLKVDRASLRGISPRRRGWMYASGAVASMGLPWIIVPSSFSLGPYWVGVFFVMLVLGNTLFTLYFSPKRGDLHRAKMAKA